MQKSLEHREAQKTHKKITIQTIADQILNDELYSEKYKKSVKIFYRKQCS